MTRRESVDVVVIGAGPAGCTAALRLLAMGRRVAVVERHEFPRPRVGEALSPGVRELLEYLQIRNALNGARSQHGVPTRIVWERREPELVAHPQHQLGVIVDRGEFDACLLASVRDSGGQTFQPAEPRRIDGEPGAWEVLVSTPTGPVVVATRLILDARGRGGHARTRVPTAPETVALWTHCRGAMVPQETLLEATEQSWLWGAALPCGRYRLMAFVDPGTVKGRGTEDVFRDLLGRSALFAWARSEFAAPVRSCSATPFIDQDAWKPGALKLGEAALALDPLSSSGVEKAMRLALQSAVAANTVLRDPTETDFAREFYESSVVSGAAAHAVWTRGSYARAWPGDGFTFWHSRSRPLPASAGEPAIAARVREASQTEQQLAERGPEPTAATNGERPQAVAVGELMDVQVWLAPLVRFVRVPCVVGDVIEPRLAVTHPALNRPLAFLAGVEIAPLLRVVPGAQSLGHLVALWSSRLPPDVSARLIGWLIVRGLLGTGDER